jgi:hypothetical protein
METPLFIKSLTVRQEPDNRLAFRGVVVNRAAAESPPIRLFLAPSARRNMMTARMGVTLSAVAPAAEHTFETTYRLKEMAFFTVQCRLEKQADIDYSVLDSFAQGRTAAAAGLDDLYQGRPRK